MSKASEFLRLSEGISNDQRKIFVNYAVEILGNLKKAYPKVSDKDQYLFTLRHIMQNMSLPDDNPNYKNSLEFLPKQFDKELFDNGDKNPYDSVWMRLKTAGHETVYRQAINKFFK